MKLSTTIKNNPLHLITTVIAIIGVLVSFANFYVLSKIAPLAARVDAIERRNAGADALLPQFYIVQGDVSHIKSDMAEIKNDIKDIKNYINIR